MFTIVFVLKNVKNVWYYLSKIITKQLRTKKLYLFSVDVENKVGIAVWKRRSLLLSSVTFDFLFSTINESPKKCNEHTFAKHIKYNFIICFRNTEKSFRFLSTVKL